MIVGVRRFLAPKSGQSLEQCDDALAAHETRGRFAVADGATEGAFNGLWARTLVAEFTTRDAAEGLSANDWFAEAQERWCDEIAAIEVPWHAEDAVRKGAFATFLGVSISEDDDQLSWRAVAIGDTCLFHARAGALLAAFPVERADAFGARPALVGSRSSSDQIDARLAQASGRLQPGDRLWLMTDALAQWFLREHEGGSAPDRTLAALLESPTGDGFQDWLNELRRDEQLRNDDVALLAIEF